MGLSKFNDSECKFCYISGRCCITVANFGIYTLRFVDETDSIIDQLDERTQQSVSPKGQ